MAALIAPATVSPPPVPPGLDPGLNSYLQQFSLWAQNNFSATLSDNQGLPGVLLLANDAAAGVSPATYQLAVDSAGELQTRSIASGSGASGSWTTIGDMTGVTDGSDAAAGMIGEFVYIGGSQTVTSAVVTNLYTLNLTAGDWDVEGDVLFAFSSGNFGSIVVAGVSLTSATFPNLRLQYNTNTASISDFAGSTGTTRVSVSAATPVYLVAQANFSAGTCTTTSLIRARRMR